MADLDVRILDNDAGPIGEALARCLERSDRADVSVAFARRSGLEELTALPRFQERGGRLRFLAGTDFQQTELEVLDRLDRGAPTEVKVNVSGEALEARRTFHPKVYVCRSEDRVEAIVGSANFTRGGLRTNVETAVLLSGAAKEPDLLVPPKSLAQATGRTWLLITNAENYRLCVEDSTWGNPTRSKIEKMRPGDRVLFYIKSPHVAVGAAGLVSSEVYEDRRPLWKDREYPFRLRLQILLEPKVQVPFKPMVPHLAGFKDVRAWGTRLQTSQLELLPADAAYLWDTVRAASTPVRLLDSTLFAAADPAGMEGNEPE